MNSYSNWVGKLTETYSSTFCDERTRLLFQRGVYFYFILKIILAWKASVLVAHVIPLSSITNFPLKLFFVPSELFYNNPQLFLAIGLSLLVINCWRPNYVISSLIFWFGANYFRVHYPIANGADIVLLTLLFLSIGLSVYPKWNRWKGLQMLVFNGASFIIKIQVAIIYLLSGVDKLYSDAWRSGTAIDYMVSLDYLFNPRLVGIFPSIPWFNFLMAWMVILFEIGFSFLIWTKKFRLGFLTAGVLFHLAIIFALSLVDFGLIMIISYLIFISDDDLKKLTSTKNKTGLTAS